MNKEIKPDEDLERGESAQFKGLFRARTVGSSTVLTAPAAEVGLQYALFVSPRNILVFVPVNRLQK